MPERMSWNLGIARSRWLTIAAGAVIATFAFSLCRRGIILSDEGYILLQSLDMLGGKILYRDMDAFVAPGIWFLHALIFKLLEPSVLASRILAFSAYVTLLYLAHRIVAGLASRNAAWSVVGILMVFTIWAFPAWTFSFYSPFSIVFALWGLERTLAWRLKRRTRDLLLGGFLLGLSIAFKQNYGILALVGIVLGLLAIRLEAREGMGAALRGVTADAARLGGGAAGIALPLFAYFAYHDALGPAFDALVVHPFEFGERQDIPYLALSEIWQRYPLSTVDRLTYGASVFSQLRQPFFWWYEPRFLERLHVLLYWIPPLVFPAGAAIALRPLRSGRAIDAGLLTLLLVSGFVFLGVFPRADFNHLANVFQPLLIAGVVVVHRLAVLLPAPRPLAVRAGAWIGSALLAVCIYAAGFWYVHMLGTMDTPVPHRRGGVLVAEPLAQLLGFNVDMIHKKTREGEALLTVPDLAMLNFLAERGMPSRYYNLYEHHISHDGGAGVVSGAKAHGVRLAVTRYNNFFSDRVGLREYAPVLARYLRTQFDIEFTVAIDQYIFLSRRETPLPESETLRVLDRCDPSEGNQLVREHLFFESLYHNFDTKFFDGRVETPCTVTVPARAELAVSIGYREPFRVRQGSSLKMGVDVRTDRGSEPLLSETLLLRRQQNWFSPPFPEYRIDLSRFANQEVVLSFRSVFRGDVRMNALDIVGFAAAWRDPRIEVRGDGG
jgi:hypothetical protein